MERALERALDDWRQLPSEELADHIDDLSDALTARTPALSPGRWLAAAVSPTASDLGPALASLPSFGDPLLPARLELLHRWPRDPRIASGLHRLLCQVVPRAGETSLWSRLLALFAATGDLRAAAWLQDASTVLDGTAWQVQRLRVRIEQVRADLVGVNPVARAPLPRRAAVSAHVPAPLSTQVPLEREARLVLADQLSDRGDPRGEAIVLGALPQPRRQQRRRARQLVREHGRAWLGRLSPAFKPQGLRFRDGAVVGGALSMSRLLEHLIGLPEWATVEELECSDLRRLPWRERGETLARLLSDPSMRSLRRVHGLPFEAVNALLRRGRPLGLERICAGATARPAAGLADEVACSKVFPQLVTLVIGHECFELEPLRRQLGRRGLLQSQPGQSLA